MSSEQHRHECEVRWLAALPSNDRRKKYLEGVKQKRGKAAADRLRVDAWNLMRGNP
jgi:hypothetical protein